MSSQKTLETKICIVEDIILSCAGQLHLKFIIFFDELLVSPSTAVQHVLFEVFIHISRRIEEIHLIVLHSSKHHLLLRLSGQNQLLPKVQELLVVGCTALV